jgi:hypothetical protein
VIPDRPNRREVSAVVEWSEVVWLVYRSPDGRARVVAPRSQKIGRKRFGSRPLRPAELRPGEVLVGTVRGVSRRTVEQWLAAGRDLTAAAAA